MNDKPIQVSKDGSSVSSVIMTPERHETQAYLNVKSV